MTITESPRPTDGDAPVLTSRRTVNDAIALAATRFELDEGNVFEFMCECGNRRCHEMVKMTLDEFWATGAGRVLAVGHSCR